MTKVREVIGSRGTTYRVQLMVKGQKFDKSFTTKEAAEKYIALVKGGIAAGPTVSSILDRYVNDPKAKDYWRKVKHCSFWDEKFGHLYACQLSHSLVDDILKSAAIDNNWTAKTCDRYRSSLSMAFTTAGLDNLNPARNMKYAISKDDPSIYSNYGIAYTHEHEIR